MNEDFLQKMIKQEFITRDNFEKIEQIIKDDSFLHKAYIENCLFISTANRIDTMEDVDLYKEEKQQQIESIIENTKKEKTKDDLKKRYEAIKEYHKEEQELEPLLMNTFEAMKEYKLSNNLATLHNIDALNAIKLHEANEGVQNKKFGISIEMFPRIKYESELCILYRSDSYNLDDNLIKICPNNLPHDMRLALKSEPKSLFAHELAHAVDSTANKDNLSVEGLKHTIEKYFPTIDATNVREVRTALTNAASLYPKDFNECYDVKGIINDSHNLNPAPVGAAHEFVSFFAQSVSECLAKPKVGEDFSTAYGEYIRKEIRQISPPPTDRDKLFALDVMSNCSRAYVSRFINPEVKKLFQDVDKAIAEKKEEINEEINKGINIKGLVEDIEVGKINKNVIVVLKPKDFNEKNEQHKALSIALEKAGISFSELTKEESRETGKKIIEPYLYLEQKQKELEIKDKALEELIEKIKNGEVNVAVVDRNFDSSLYWRWDADAYEKLDEATKERNTKLLAEAQKADPKKRRLKPEERVQVIDLSIYNGEPTPTTIIFSGYLDEYLKQHLTPAGKETIPKLENQMITPTIPEVTAEAPNLPPMEQTANTLSINNTQTSKADINKGAEHLKKVNQELTHRSEEASEHNLKASLAAINDNQDLLERIDKTAAITANVGIKAIGAEKSVDTEKTGKVEIRGEESHLTDHANNNKSLIKEIQEGNIDSNTVIAIERKQYGENQGMKDIIKIANILEHNEKNPNNTLKLPEGLENTPTYQDALLYKAAKENGITVISLEGRNLEHAQNSVLYNENREQYMTNVINEVRSKGYNVIASVGSNHVATLEKALESNQRENIGFSQMPRKLQDNNIKKTDENTLQKPDIPPQPKSPTEQQNEQKANSHQIANNMRKRLSTVNNQFSTSKSKHLNISSKKLNTNSLTR
jgi:hypothetical protein